MVNGWYNPVRLRASTYYRLSADQQTNGGHHRTSDERKADWLENCLYTANFMSESGRLQVSSLVLDVRRLLRESWPITRYNMYTCLQSHYGRRENPGQLFTFPQFYALISRLGIDLVHYRFTNMQWLLVKLNVKTFVADSFRVICTFQLCFKKLQILYYICIMNFTFKL